MAEFSRIVPRQQEVKFLYTWFIEESRTFSSWTSKSLSQDEENLVDRVFDTPACEVSEHNLLLEVMRMKVDEAFKEFIEVRELVRRFPRTSSVAVNDHIEQALVAAKNRCGYLSAVLAWHGWLFKEILPYTQQTVST